MAEQLAMTLSEATGYSDTYSFDEAFRNALEELPPPNMPYPDQLLRTRVLAVGSEIGGIAGVNRLYVRVQRLPDPITDSGTVFVAAGGDVPFPFGQGTTIGPGALGDLPLVVAGGGEPFPLGATTGNDLRKAAPVYAVNLVGVDVLESNPPQFVIRACGQVTTTGWTNGRLRPISTKTPPVDGIYEFEFVATPPSGIVAQVITPIASHPLRWQPDDGGTVQGVRVTAATNHITQPVS